MSVVILFIVKGYKISSKECFDYYCLELDNGKIHKDKEFMNIWKLIVFYNNFNLKCRFFLSGGIYPDIDKEVKYHEKKSKK